MSEALVTVCIATYNHGQFITKCLESVVSQKTTFDFKVIVGDDFSPDNSQGIIRNLSIQHPEKITTILRHENLGSPHNGLDLWKQVKSKYIAIIDGDDYWTDPYKLQKQVAYLEANTDCSFCFTDCQIERKKTLQEIHPNFKRENQFTGIDFADQTGSIAQTCTWLVRRECIQNLPNWVTSSYTGDWCMQVHFSKFGKGGYIPEKTAVYRIHDNGMWSKLSEFEGWHNNLKFYKLAHQQLCEKNSKKRLKDRIKKTIVEALELANIQANKSEIRKWLWIKLTSNPFSSVQQSIHSFKLLLVF